MQNTSVLHIKNPYRPTLKTSNKLIQRRIGHNHYTLIILGIGKFVLLIKILYIPDSDREI